MKDDELENILTKSIMRENIIENIMVFPLSSVTIAINMMIAVYPKNCSVNKLNPLPRYIRLDRLNISPCPNRMTEIIAVNNGITIVTRMDPNENTRNFAIKIRVLLLPLIS